MSAVGPLWHPLSWARGAWRRSRERRRAERARLERLHDALRAMRLPVPFDLDQVLRNVGEDRGRPIIVLAWHFAGSKLTGLYVRDEGIDYVLFEAVTSPLHQLRIILHELGHIVLGHEPRHPLPPELRRWPGRRVGDRLVACAFGAGARALERGDEWTAEDDEAEDLAALTLAEAARWQTELQLTDPEAIAMISRLAPVHRDEGAR